MVVPFLGVAMCLLGVGSKRMPVASERCPKHNDSSDLIIVLASEICPSTIIKSE